MTQGESSELSLDVVLRMLSREKNARKEAERLLEDRSRKLYSLNVALEQQFDLIHAILDTAADGILVFDSEGVVQVLNGTARRVFRLAEEESPTLDALIRTETLSSLTTRAGESEEAVELEVIGIRNGTDFPLEIKVRKFKVQNEFRYSCVVRDLTQKKKKDAESALSQKMESVGRLAAGIAHELNSPIQYVADNTRFLKSSYEHIQRVLRGVQDLLRQSENYEGLRGPVAAIKRAQDEAELEFLMDEIPEALAQTLYGAETVARIVGAMKEFSHPGSSEFCKVDLNAALESTLTVSKGQWKQTAKVICNFADYLPKVECLAAELNQVFLNLIMNAADAIESRWRSEPGIITVTTKSENQSVIVEISDNGTGIPERIREQVFDPFFTTKEVGKGTGQGLSICHEIIKQHAGDISVESQLGKGTTFRIRLPVTQPERGQESHKASIPPLISAEEARPPATH